MSYAAQVLLGVLRAVPEAAGSAPSSAIAAAITGPANVARRCGGELDWPRERTRSDQTSSPYLDVVAAARARFDVPIFAYNVSGEYAMLKVAAARVARGAPAALESLTAIKRAGADVIVTYWAKDVARWL